MVHTIEPAGCALIGIVTEDFAADYYGERGPYFFDVGSVVLCLVEINLHTAVARYGFAPVWTEVTDYLKQHPQVLTRSAADRRARAELRREEGDRIRQAAMQAYRAADYDRAAHLIDYGELIEPRHNWQHDRDKITAATAPF